MQPKLVLDLATPEGCKAVFCPLAYPTNHTSYCHQICSVAVAWSSSAVLYAFPILRMTTGLHMMTDVCDCRSATVVIMSPRRRGALSDIAIGPSVRLSVPGCSCPRRALPWAIGSLVACNLATAGHQRCADCGPVRGRT